MHQDEIRILTERVNELENTVLLIGKNSCKINKSQRHNINTRLMIYLCIGSFAAIVLALYGDMQDGKLDNGEATLTTIGGIASAVIAFNKAVSDGKLDKYIGIEDED